MHQAHSSNTFGVDSGFVANHRRRLRSDETSSRMAAKAVVAATNQKLGPWQASSVHLLMVARRLAIGGPVSQFSAQAKALRRAVEVETATLDSALSVLPAEVQSQSAILDTQRALAGVTARLGVARQLLEIRP